MTISENIKRIIAAYRLTLLLAEGKAADPSEPLTSSVPESKNLSGVHYWARLTEKRIERLARLAETEVQAIKGGRTDHDRSHPAYVELRKAILEEQGVSAIEVAYLLCCTERLVKEYRTAANQDPETGASTQKTLTAPPNETYRQRKVNRK